MRRDFWLTNLYRQLTIPTIRRQTHPRRNYPRQTHRRQTSTSHSAIIELLEPRQLLSAAAVVAAAPTVSEVLDGTGTIVVRSGDRLTSSVSSLSVVFSDNLNAVPGGANSVTNRKNWDFTRYGVDVNDQVSGITFGLDPNTNRYTALVSFTQPLAEGGYQLVARQTIQDLAGQALDGDADGFAGGDFRRYFAVTTTVPAGPETQANPVIGGRQTQPAVAMDASGDYVTVWSSYTEDGSGYGVYAQRYDAEGGARGNQFRVNTYTKGYQGLASVAMDAAGDFVIAWQSFGQNGTGMGIYAQRYNASGVAQGGEFQVNTITTHSQECPSVAMNAEGDFVIVWWSRSLIQSENAIHAQRYNAAGVAQGSVFKANTEFPGYYVGAGQPKVAMDASGDFVVTWIQPNLVAGPPGAIAQRYDASGIAQGSAFLVGQAQGWAVPTVAMDAAGDFVVTTYQSEPEGGGKSIYAHRYNSAGVIQGSFPVTTSTTYGQVNATVAMDAAGDFVIAWQRLGSYDYYAKRYSKTGTSVGPEFRVNTRRVLNYLQYWDPPAVAMHDAGNFVVAWRNEDTSLSGIGLQRYQADVAPVLTQIETAPLVVIAQLTLPVTSSLQVFDYDSNYWTGATIRIAANYEPDREFLNFVNTSTPKIKAAWNNSTGTLTLSGTDTVSNYRTAMRNVSYFHSKTLPNAVLTRTISFQVTDGLLPSNVVSRKMTVLDQPVSPGAPVILSGAPVTGTYVEKSIPLPIAPNLVATDPNSLNFMSATISFTNWQGEDRLNYKNVFGFQTSFTEDFVAHTASLTFIGNHTIDHYMSTLRSIAYWDISANPIAAPRIAKISVSDGVFTSNVVSVSLFVSAVNDPPLLSGIETSPLIWMANDPAYPPKPISATVLVSDPDSYTLTKLTVQITTGYQNDANGHDVLSFKNQLGITGVFDASTGTMTLTGASSVSNYRTALRSVLFSTSGRAVSGATRTLTMLATDDYSPTPATSRAITRNITVLTTG